MTDYETLVKTIRETPTFGDESRNYLMLLAQSAAAAVEALVAERDTLRTQLDGMTAPKPYLPPYMFVIREYKGGNHRAVVAIATTGVEAMTWIRRQPEPRRTNMWPELVPLAARSDEGAQLLAKRAEGVSDGQQ